ncbi:hypothetical protein [Thermococcus sp.]|uniref:hypothetical protein n=1 Tax=Thermococcus sp. TaxID=35749 RepID=UPI00262E21A1|nr:hypothetical protein [Thermococcus sp.]
MIMLNISPVINMVEGIAPNKNPGGEPSVENEGDSVHSRPKITSVSWREMLPPVEFVEWLADSHLEVLTPAQWETVEPLYTSKSFREASRKSGRHKNVVKKAWERLIAAFEEYRGEWESSKFGMSQDPSGMGTESVETPASPKFRSTPKRPQKTTAGRTELRYSFKTTTFREVDRVISGLLSSEVKDMLVRRDIYSKLGEKTLLLLIQRGYVDVRQLLHFSSDPDAFLGAVEGGLERLIEASDPHKIKQLERENWRLRYRVMELEMENKQLRDIFEQCMEDAKILIDLLDKRQLLRFSKILVIKEQRKKLGIKAGFQ